MENNAYDGPRIHVRGYRPVGLTLTGFKGIRSGLGRETLRLNLEALAGDATLVAIAGTTCTPYVDFDVST